MKRAKYIKKDGETLVFYDFSSMIEFLHFVSSSKRITYKNCSEEGSYSFSGTSSLKEAMTMCKNGYFDENVAHFQKVYLKMAKQINREVRNTQAKRDFIGFTPNVPLYLQGYPKNMINVDPEKRVKSPRPIIIHFNVAVGAEESKKHIQRRGLCFLCLYDMLKKLKCDVELQLCKVTEDVINRDIFLNVQVPLVKENDPINISKIFFPLVHPSFLRRIGLAFDERCPELEDKEDWFLLGYGKVGTLRSFYKEMEVFTNKDYTKDNKFIHIFADDYIYEYSEFYSKECSVDRDINAVFTKILLDLQKEGAIDMSKEQIKETVRRIDFLPIENFECDPKYYIRDNYDDFESDN